jgi:hypothetical protein
MFTSRRTLWPLLLGVVMAAGCSDKKTTKPNPQPSPYEKATSPEAVLRNLQVAFEAKDAAAYDSLLYDCGADTTNAYSFWFAEEDVVSGVPPSWGRDAETCAAVGMFESPSIDSTALSLTFAGSFADTTQGRRDQRIVVVPHVDLTVFTSDGQGNSINYYVEDQRSDFRFKVQWVDAKGDSLWRIVYWKDWGNWGKRAAVEHPTWGKLKSMVNGDCSR